MLFSFGVAFLLAAGVGVAGVPSSWVKENDEPNRSGLVVTRGFAAGGS